MIGNSDGPVLRPARSSYLREAAIDIQELRNVPVLRGLNDEALAVISDLFSRWDCRKGQIIFNEGDRSENFYVVVSGNLDVQVSTGFFGKVVIAELSAGDIFGEMAFIDAEKRSASILAKSACTLLSMTRNDFRKLGKGYPHVSGGDSEEYQPHSGPSAARGGRAYPSGERQGQKFGDQDSRLLTVG